ncbi:hypothetical protein PVAP13_6NG134206 [Panicum virgatum]|uniref:Uncharacterized protein n=1 Tax=Panicum virgatum TaxID=38727 RepID=A0A8T0R0H5_PANVG|nr:hypothetical protein PVAP13_6NG134206 [Panicum virgatum]
MLGPGPGPTRTTNPGLTLMRTNKALRVDGPSLAPAQA